MKNKFLPTEIPILSAPVTSANRRNANNNPVINLHTCTSFQLIESAGIDRIGSVCFIGNTARGIGMAKALVRRCQKPFLFLGTSTDKDSLFSALSPEWDSASARAALPNGDGAIYFSKPYDAYLEIVEYLEVWAQSHVIILHLGNGLQAGTELLNLFSAIGQCLIFCDSVPQSIRLSDTNSITTKQFLCHMKYLCVFCSGVETKELIELLPTYQYETITNTTGFNTFKSRSFLHPLHMHRGHGFTASQSRTTDFKKSVLEMDELTEIFNAGYMLVYNARTNCVFLAYLS